MTVPTKLDFAQEVRAERLSLLWKITLVLALFLVWGALILTSLNATNPADLFLPIVLVAAGCIGCREFLRRDRYVEAVWSYIITLNLCPSSEKKSPGDPKLSFSGIGLASLPALMA